MELRQEEGRAAEQGEELYGEWCQEIEGVLGPDEDHREVIT